MQKSSSQPPDQTSNRKAILRDQARLIRRRISPAMGEAAAKALAEAGLQLLKKFNSASAIGGYYPIRDELSPLALLEALHRSGFGIALPKIKNGLVSFRKWRPGKRLVSGPFGTKEPEELEPEVIPNPIFVPLLAFDRMGNRLGYGAGYYDTVLRALRSMDGVTAIGAGFDEQEMPEIPREPQDETLDLILTPSRVIVCRK